MLRGAIRRRRQGAIVSAPSALPAFCSVIGVAGIPEHGGPNTQEGAAGLLKR